MSIVIIGASSGSGRMLFEQLRDEAVEVLVLLDLALNS